MAFFFFFLFLDIYISRYTVKLLYNKLIHTRSSVRYNEDLLYKKGIAPKFDQ